MSEEKLPLRSEVDLRDTWDLSTIFSNDGEWEKAFAYIESNHSKALAYKGKLDSSADILYEAIQFEEEISRLLGKVDVYSHLKFDTDTTNSTYQAMSARVLSLYGQVSTSFSFMSSELMAADKNVIMSYLETKMELNLYKHDFEKLFSKQEHILSEKEEKLLAEGSEVFEVSTNTFGMLNNADLQFPVVSDSKGKEYQLSQGRYTLLLESSDRVLRENAFRAFYKTFQDVVNTLATTLSGKVKTDNFFARIRYYESARAAALGNNDIPENVYDALIEAVNESLPLLHRYISLRKKSLKLDNMAMYDLLTPLVEEPDMKFTYQEAQKIVKEALLPLGEEYQRLLDKAFTCRWIDVVENVGKRSGAYSSGTYDTSPYILLNWQDNLANVFTLAHELGHSMHSYYTRENQPYVYGRYSIFLAEIASTTNEILLTDYLLQKYENPKIRAYILNHYLDEARATVFRQTQFAEFEHFIHKAQQEGEALTAEFLTTNYAEMNQKYYGTDLVYDEEIGVEWARIPHFYYNYYVYQYATGFSAASTLANKILMEGQSAVDSYIEYLKAGCSDYPIEVMKKAGVDMTGNQAVLDTMKIFERRLIELEELLKK